jgi:hypothetical protein
MSVHLMKDRVTALKCQLNFIDKIKKEKQEKKVKAKTKQTLILD